jgi:hypothetical protein
LITNLKPSDLFLLPWLAPVLKTSIARQGYGTCKKEKSGAGGFERTVYFHICCPFI